MGDAGRWWHRVSAAAVLTVLAVAMIAGLRPTPGVAVRPPRVGARKRSSARACVRGHGPGGGPRASRRRPGDRLAGWCRLHPGRNGP